jgi:hypothetical protein
VINRRGATAAATFAGAALVGLAGGWWLARSYDRTQRERLFARSPWRRHAALGHLEHEGDVATIPLLRDYLAWEVSPALQARGRRVLARLEALLG